MTSPHAPSVLIPGDPEPRPVPSRSLSITALVLGIVSLVTGVTAVPAVICGHMALRREPDDKGLAIAGLVTGYTAIVGNIIALIVLGLWFLAFAGSVQQ
jgi:hypothetical protein